MSRKICYAPNGSSRNEQVNATEGAIWAPCDNTAEVSMCCAIGPSRDGTTDICLENGLCRNDILWDGLFWRESCTDPTWEDPACIKLFLNGTGFSDTILFDDGQPITDVNLTACDNGSWCTGENNRACCQNGEGVFVFNGQQVEFDPSATTTSSSTIISSSTTFTTSSSFSSPPSTPTESSSSSQTASSSTSLSTGAKAGIVVGVAIAALLILALIIWFFWRKRKIVRPQPAELGAEPAPVMLEAPQPRYELPSPPPKSASTALYDSTQSGGSDSGNFHSKSQPTPVERYA